MTQRPEQALAGLFRFLFEARAGWKAGQPNLHIAELQPAAHDVLQAGSTTSKMPGVIVLRISGQTLSVGLSDKPEMPHSSSLQAMGPPRPPRIHSNHLGGDVSCFNSRSTVVVFVS